MVLTPKRVKMDIAKFLPYDITYNDDCTTVYKLYGAYTHLLRKVL